MEALEENLEDYGVRPRLYHREAASALAGAASGFIASFIVGAAYAIAGAPVLLPFRLASAALMGETAFLPSMQFVATLLGWTSVLLMGALLALVFGFFTKERALRRLTLLGLVYGALLGLLLYGLSLAGALNPSLSLRSRPGLNFVGFILYGLGLSLIRPAEKILLRKEVEEIVEPAETAARVPVPGSGALPRREKAA